jgi:methylenetetrahydrofolate dehydrogenase (NADP+)/methenyltetrahydrofolate cyclohydrolase
VADAWECELANEAAEIRAATGRAPSLAVVLVGDRPDSCLYVSRKAEAAARAGINCAVRRLPAAVTQAGLCAAVASLCADSGVDGVIVQLPLPPHLDAEAVMCSGALDPRKDVDGLHPANLG